MSISIIKNSRTDLRVRLPIVGQPANIVAEFKLAPNASGDGVWTIMGLLAHDTNGIVPDVVLNDPGLSVYEFASQIGYFTDLYNGSNYDFGGCGHGHETLLYGPQFWGDGVYLGLIGDVPAGPTSYGNFVMKQRTSVLKPVGTGAGLVIGNRDYSHECFATGVRFQQYTKITAANIAYRTAYGAMMPGNVAMFDRASYDGTVINLLHNDSIPVTGKQAQTFVLYNSDTSVNPYRVQMYLDYGLPEVAGSGWSLSNPPKAWFYDRVAYPKWYVNWVADAITAAVDSQHLHTYSVSYQL